MARRKDRSGIGGRVLAAMMSAGLTFSNALIAVPGATAYAGEDNSLFLQNNVSATNDEGVLSEGDKVDLSADYLRSLNPDLTEEQIAAIQAAAVSEGGLDAAMSLLSAGQAETSQEEGSSSGDRTFEYNKTDVWDFGAENLGDAYNNRLDSATINGFYSVESGKSGVKIGSFSLDGGDFLFNDGTNGGDPSHRLRTTNTGLTRYDEKSLKDEEGNVYSGYLYSNKGSTADVYVAVDCKADDIITAYVASNGSDSDIHFMNMSDSGDDTVKTHKLGSGTASRFEFYPSQDARYKFYSENEKLVIARVYRQHATYGNVAGTVTGFAGTGSFDIVFTNEKNGNVVKATVADGKFSAKLAAGFDYALSLEGADEYVITSEKKVNISGDSNLAVGVAAVDLVKVKGSIQGIETKKLESFTKSAVISLKPQDENAVYVPKPEIKADGSFEVTLQAGVIYDLSAEGVDDYELETKTLSSASAAEGVEIRFAERETTKIAVNVKGGLVSPEELAGTEFKFILLDKEKDFADTAYSYTFTGKDITDGKAALRNGQYRLEVTNVPENVKFDEVHSFDAIIDEAHTQEGVHTVTVPFIFAGAGEEVAYRQTLTVGKGRDYETVSGALDAIRKMNRAAGERVTVEIDPGDYQEMLVIDAANVTLKNAVRGASIVPTGSGTTIGNDSVRITGYYGHGYTYYSMGSDCKYDAELLEVNRYNGYASFTNPGSGTTSGSYWNATVVVEAEGFEAKDIIFENSFNQYQSALAASDVIVKQGSAKEGAVPRAEMEAGDTAVQDKKYVERAAAMAIRTAAGETYFDHCAFIGRQDTLYGDAGSKQGYYNCDIYGGTDYIFGGMTAVFAKCNLIFNTSEDKNDVGYITAAQQKSGDTRGYLMYNCTVKSTEPGVNTASQFGSKAGYLGRPWQANTSEVVFFNTVIEATCDQFKDGSASLINPVGWNTSLGGESKRNVEYATYELSGVNNSASRASWVPVSEKALTGDGQPIAVSTFLGSWDPFTEHGNDMTIVLPDGTTQSEPVNDAPVSKTAVYTLETKTFDTFGAGAKADGTSVAAGTDNYFDIIYSVKSKVDTSSKTWEDGYSSDVRINFGGGVTNAMNAVKFTTSAKANVKVWWVAGDVGRNMGVLNAAGEEIVKSDENSEKNKPYIWSFKLDKPGTYFLGGSGSNSYIFKVEVTEGEAEEVVRADWSDIASPVISSVSLNSDDKGKIDVTVKANVGDQGGDALSVVMYDESDAKVSEQKSVAASDESVLSFAPKKSGKYYFAAALSRKDEQNVKMSENSDKLEFSYPLTAPQFKNAVNKGNGRVTVKFYSVAEATGYTLVASDKTDVSAKDIEVAYPISEAVNNTDTEYEYDFEGLTVGHDYLISAVAGRKRTAGGQEVTDRSKEGTVEITVSESSEREWVFSAFGSGVSSSPSTNGYKVNDDGSVSVWSLSNKGKIVPNSTDGLSFYYTAVPADKNFTLTATMDLDSWKLTNGQEGFGIMAADRVGKNGDATSFWNNSFMALGTKVEYYYDSAKNEVTTDTTSSKITMKNGLAVQEKTGVTKENISRIESGDTATINSEFSTHTYPLEVSYGKKGTGTYNIWGNAKEDVPGSLLTPITRVRLRIQKNNTGYFVSYLDENDGVLSTRKFYDTEALSQLDKENIYVGFIASRDAKATFSDISLNVIDPADDAAVEERPASYVVPSYRIVSADHSNTADYSLSYSGNADGTLTITDPSGKTIVNHEAVSAGEVKTAKVVLNKGNNKFGVKFVPDENFHPGNDEYQFLSSYEMAEFDFVVKYDTINNSDKLYVGINGKAGGDGSRENPVDIYSAVKYVQPGQTIVLEAGTYNLGSTVTIARGIDGTASAPIKMTAEGGRAVFDFGRKSAGFILAGNYWHIEGIDCTKTANAQKGIQVSGSHITLRDIRTYENGNTGIQVSRYLSSDDRDLWPSYDLILNCTSYSNADSGYEDADGFAAKLTVGEGVVFDGCIAYNNADDGWDLFAKVETGPIGQVTIQNSVAFSNGFGIDGTNEGNGNGFKMGGSSISGPHRLINSVAWNNKAKGIDSNSGPDIQVYHSMSFNNGSNNVALYTNDTANTDYYVDGVLSYRTEAKSTNENIKAKGTQDQSKIYGKKNFFWNDGKSSNTEGLTVSDDWFESLNAPVASANDPYKVASDLRTTDGRIDLGSFLKLTEKGESALLAAGLNAGDVAAYLDGNYEAASSGSQNIGPADNGTDREESAPENGNGSAGSKTEQTQPKTDTDKTAKPSTENKVSETAVSSGNESKGSASTAGTEVADGNPAQEKQEEAFASDNAAGGQPESNSGNAAGNDEADIADVSDITDISDAGTDEDTQIRSDSNETAAEERGVSANASNSAVTASAEPAGAPANTAQSSAAQVAGVQRNDNKSKSTKKTEDAAVKGFSEIIEEIPDAEIVAESDVQAEAKEEANTPGAEIAQNVDGAKDAGAQKAIEQNIEDEAVALESSPDTSVPVVPIAAGTTAVVAIAAVAAVKTGLMAKILAALHILK